MSVGHLSVKAARPLIVGEVHIHAAFAVCTELFGADNTNRAPAGVRVNVNDAVILYLEPVYGSPTHLLSEYSEITSCSVCDMNSHKISSVWYTPFTN